ncbi:hypothetical protein OAO18_06395 [Francisellaceae bacterium]|nr:hypothetical protein [Francisellaceae bacterium]
MMKSVEWHDGQKLRPVDLDYQAICVQDNMAVVNKYLFTKHTEIIDIEIDNTYLGSGILKITKIVGIFNGTFIAYPLYDQDIIVYELPDLDLKTQNNDHCEVFLYIEGSKSYQSKTDNVNIKATKLNLTTTIVNKQTIKLCELIRTEENTWKINPAYIPRFNQSVRLIKYLLKQRLEPFLIDFYGYITHRHNSIQNSWQASLIYRIQTETILLTHMLSDKYNEPIYYHNLLEKMVHINILLAQMERSLDIQDSVFEACESHNCAVVIDNFIESMRTLMIQDSIDEKLNFYEEDDQLRAAVSIDKNDTLYLILMKPNNNFTYNYRRIRLASPSRIQELRFHSIPGVKIEPQYFNPTSLSLDRKIYDIYEIIPSREVDNILSDGMIICDKETLPEGTSIFLIKKTKGVQ